MKNFLCFILSLSIIAGHFSIAYAQDEEPISEAHAMLQETTQTDQSDVPPIEDSYNDNLNPQQRFEQNPKHNVHEYNYKQQVIVGGVVMFCVALAMIANNNYNPKKPTP